MLYFFGQAYYHIEAFIVARDIVHGCLDVLRCWLVLLDQRAGLRKIIGSHAVHCVELYSERLIGWTIQQVTQVVVQGFCNVEELIMKFQDQNHACFFVHADMDVAV